MSAYKKLNKQDAFITTYTAHKEWIIGGNVFSNYGIELQSAGSRFTLEGLQQLYYRNKDNQGRIASHSYDLYNQTTLFYSSSRNLTTGSLIISIPRQIYGIAIEPGTFKLEYLPIEGEIEGIGGIGGIRNNSTEDNYIVNTPGTILEKLPSNTIGEDPPRGGGPIRVNPPLGEEPTIEEATAGILLDDGEGNLYKSGSNPRDYLGDIIYPHGMVIITNPTYWSTVGAMLFGTREQQKEVTVSFRNTLPIFTHNYHCKIRDFEYNYTYNPSTLSGSVGTVYNSDGETYSTSGSINKGDRQNNITGSIFQPYITTIGLYNDANELIAVGKTGQPIPKSANTEMTIIVKIDI
jgi:hypothetical protein